MTTKINEFYDIKAIELVPLLPTDQPIKAAWVHQDKLDSAGNYLRKSPVSARKVSDSVLVLNMSMMRLRRMQTIMIGLLFEVQRNMFRTHLNVTKYFQMYSTLPPERRIIINYG